MTSSKISVAMTLYNGAKYLLEQLDSLREQSLPPDELIACDDGSSDDTERLFIDYIKKYNLGNQWKYIRNKQTLGAMCNFINCASKCSGEIIFFCDQDDIWDKNKINEMKRVFIKNEDALAVSCSQIYVDSSGIILRGGV